MARACAQCGTEVDDDALFCPTCGEPIERGAEPDLPPAPDWPATASGATLAVPPPPTPSAADVGGPPTAEQRSEREATRATPAASASEMDVPPAAESVEARPAASGEEATIPPWRRGAAYRAAAPPPAPSGPVLERPGALRPEGIVRPPETLSGWLIGAGALIGTVAMLLPWVVSGTYTGGWGLASGINLLFTLVLIGVVWVVFLPHLVPAIPHRNLMLLAIAMIGVGVGLDRLGLPLTGTGAMIFLIGMLACATGAFLAQLGMDRQVGGPQL
jgi:zinc ribbon protein